MRATQFQTQARGEGGPVVCALRAQPDKHTAHRHQKENGIMLPETKCAPGMCYVFEFYKSAAGNVQ